jgi:SPP1 family predicted phage head-tail adaptor
MKKQLQAGSFDRTIELRHRSEVRSGPYNERATATEVEPYATLKAKKDEVSGNETEVAKRNTNIDTVDFTIRYRTDVLATDLLTCEGVQYDVQSVIEDPNVRRMYTIITAKRAN